MPFGNHRAHEQRGSHGLSATSDEATSAPLAGLARERREASERGDLLAVELAEFRQFGDQRAGDDWADTGYRGEQVLFLAPGRRAAASHCRCRRQSP